MLEIVDVDYDWMVCELEVLECEYLELVWVDSLI